MRFSSYLACDASIRSFPKRYDRLCCLIDLCSKEVTETIVLMRQSSAIRVASRVPRPVAPRVPSLHRNKAAVRPFMRDRSAGCHRTSACSTSDNDLTTTYHSSSPPLLLRISPFTTFRSTTSSSNCLALETSCLGSVTAISTTADSQFGRS